MPAAAARPGLRDRALIGVMVYSFARVNAVIGMKVKDYFSQGRRGWVRLHEKGGKEHEVPCHHSLEKLLDENIAAAGIAGDPLFRKTGQAQTMCQQNVYRMIQRKDVITLYSRGRATELAGTLARSARGSFPDARRGSVSEQG
jgi:integrase